MASFLVFLVSGCFLPTEKVIHSGTYNGIKYVVKAHETHTFNGSRTDWRVKLGKLPEIPINVTREWGPPVTLKGDVTTDWVVPYATLFLGGIRSPILPKNPPIAIKPAYSNTGNDYRHGDESRHYYSVLYLPAGFSVTDYERRATFMKSEWAVVDKLLTTNTINQSPHMIGLVCAPLATFIQQFRGTIGGEKHVLRIVPDGYVSFRIDDGADHIPDRHCAVKMPVKAIVLHEIYHWIFCGITKADIQRFRDENGKSPADYFKLEG